MLYKVLLEEEDRMFYSDYDAHLDQDQTVFEDEVNSYVAEFNLGRYVFNPDVNTYWAEVEWSAGEPTIMLFDDTVMIGKFVEDFEAFVEWVDVRESEAVN